MAIARISSGLNEPREMVFHASEVESRRGCLQAIGRAVPLIEKQRGWRLIPEEIAKIAINLDVELSPGLASRPNLVDATLDFLEFRRYGKGSVMLVAKSMAKAKQAGFGLSGEYRGYSIVSSEDPEYFDEDWYHDSPLPPAVTDRAKLLLKYPNDLAARLREERKSGLPTVMFLEHARWINLAVARDDLVFGIRGASANATLGTCSNVRRFMNDPTLGPAATAEILAIPEFWENRLFSIVDLTEYQFAGGPGFDAEFLGGRDLLLIGDNPIALDFRALHFLAEARQSHGFKKRDVQGLPLFRFGRDLGLGDARELKALELR